jgi:glycosyltransferase 2 family protein
MASDTVPNTSNRARRRKWLIRVAQVVVLGLIAYFWGDSLWANWSDLSGYQWRFNPAYLAASLVVLLVHIVLLAQIWRWTLNELGLRRPWAETTRIWALSQIVRYLPGGIWDVAGRLVMASRAGYSRATVSASILLEMTLQTLSAIIIFLFSLFFWQDATVGYVGLWAIPLIPAGLVALHPRFLNTFLGQVARLMKVDFRPLPLRYASVFMLLLLHLLARVLVGAGFYLFALAVYPWNLAGLPVAVGIFAAAWVIGFLVVFVPMGLGVREGVMTFLLGAYLPVAPATVIAIGFRIWIALRDLLFAALGGLLQMREGDRARGDEDARE